MSRVADISMPQPASHYLDCMRLEDLAGRRAPSYDFATPSGSTYCMRGV